VAVVEWSGAPAPAPAHIFMMYALIICASWSRASGSGQFAQPVCVTVTGDDCEAVSQAVAGESERGARLALELGGCGSLALLSLLCAVSISYVSSCVCAPPQSRSTESQSQCERGEFLLSFVFGFFWRFGQQSFGVWRQRSAAAAAEVRGGAREAAESL
jgi:hypothetical protein